MVGGSRECTDLGGKFRTTTADGNKWHTIALSLADFSDSDDITIRFVGEYLAENSINSAGIYINNVIISSNAPICDDSVTCTTDTCGSTGCVNSADDTVCEAIYVAGCYSSACKPGNITADTDGCVYEANDSDCDDTFSCTTDACDQNPLVSGSGCSNTPDNSACDDNSGCTTDICNPLLYSDDGCGHIAECNDGVM